jgi:hypothetical protein
MSRSQRTLLIVLVLALLAVIAIGALHDDENGTPASPTATNASAEPRLVTPSQLADFAAASDRTTYWIGPRRGASYELTAAAGEPVYVRYLRDGAQAGDPRPDFVTVVTYPGEDGLAELRQTAASNPGAELTHGADGALVLTDPSAPKSAYLAYPETNVQIEVYSPIPDHAQRLASRGEVLRVR